GQDGRAVGTHDVGHREARPFRLGTNDIVAVPTALDLDCTAPGDERPRGDHTAHGRLGVAAVQLRCPALPRHVDAAGLERTLFAGGEVDHGVVHHDDAVALHQERLDLAGRLDVHLPHRRGVRTARGGVVHAHA